MRKKVTSLKSCLMLCFNWNYGLVRRKFDSKIWYIWHFSVIGWIVPPCGRHVCSCCPCPRLASPHRLPLPHSKPWKSAEVAKLAKRAKLAKVAKLAILASLPHTCQEGHYHPPSQLLSFRVDQKVVSTPFPIFRFFCVWHFFFENSYRPNQPPYSIFC